MVCTYYILMLKLKGLKVLQQWGKLVKKYGRY